MEAQRTASVDRAALSADEKPSSVPAKALAGD